MKLKVLGRDKTIEEIKQILNKSTIIDKIEFSGITKESISNKIKDLRERQVPQRTVFLDKDEEEILEYWSKNWLHPMLKHCVIPSPTDKRGCSQKVLQRDHTRDMLHFYENGQQNFNYTLADIEQWLNED